jgi:hypothetical protein
MKTPKVPPAGEFQIRPGAAPIGGQPWRGVDTETNPGSLDPNQLQRADNVRLVGRDIHSRPGHTEKVDLSHGVNNAILYLGRAPADNPRTRLWAVARGCLGAAVGTGGRVLHLDESEDPVVQTYGDFFAEGDRTIPLMKFGDRLYAGDKSVLRDVTQIWAPYGVATSSVVGSPPSAIVLPPFTGFVIRCGLEIDGELYIGLENVATPGSSKIVAWNGLTVKDDLTAVRPPLAMGKWREKLLVSFDATAGHIRVRNKGSAHPGTWTTHALAGFQGAEQLNSIQDVRDKTYIASGIDDIFVFDGTNLTLAHNIATADTSGSSGITALALHEGLLHYGWNEAGPTFESNIGRHDPDSSANEWVDTYKDIEGDQPNFGLLSSMMSYRRRLFIGGWQNWIISTQINDVKAVVNVFNGSATGAGFDVRQLIRFP